MNIIAAIATKVETVWSAAEAAIDADFAKIEAALPASAAPNLAAVKSDLKQAASDALSTAASGAAPYAPALSKVLETAADAALAELTGGLSQPYNPLLNSGIDKIVADGLAMLQGWALSAKAAAAPALKQSA